MRQLLLVTVIWCNRVIHSIQESTPDNNFAKLKFATPLPTSVEIFITSYCPSVTKWMIQYRESGNDESTVKSVETEPTGMHAVRVKGLKPNTLYHFRLRASQMYGTTTVTEIEQPYQDWRSTNNITTDFLSIFGKVTLSNLAYATSYKRVGSTEWKACLSTIQDAYQNDFSVPGDRVSLLRIEKSTTRSPTVHYRVKVPDLSLPSARDYSISGPGFTDCVINNGDVALGSGNIEIKGGNRETTYTLWYEEGSCPGGGQGTLVERYMIVSPEDSPTMIVHLNVASSEATLSSEEDSLNVKKNGELELDSGEVYAKIPNSILVGLTPIFLVKDCLRGSTTSVVYSEIFGPTLYQHGAVKEHMWDTTEYPKRSVNASAMSCDSDTDGTSITCGIPVLNGGYKYEILNGTAGNILGKASDEEIKCSSNAEITLRNLTTNVTYDLALRVSFRNSDGTHQSATSKTSVLVRTNVPEASSTTPDVTTSSATTRDYNPTTVTTDSTTNTKTASTDASLTQGATTNSADMDYIKPINIYVIAVIISLAVLTTVTFLLLAYFIRHRKRRKSYDIHSKKRKSSPVERRVSPFS